MIELFSILIKAVCCSVAAVGFGILFNTPGRALIFVGIGGFVAGFVKFTLMDTTIESGIVLASTAAAGAVGFVCTFIAFRYKMPPIIFLIPSVIPLIPGVFAYRTMLGLMKLSNAVDEHYLTVLSETIRYGVLTLFVVMGIALGTVLPMLVMEKTVARKS